LVCGVNGNFEDFLDFYYFKIITICGVVIDVFCECEKAIVEGSIVKVRVTEILFLGFPFFGSFGCYMDEELGSEIPAVLLDKAVIAFEGCVPRGTVAEGCGAGDASEVAAELPVVFAGALVEATAFCVI